MLMVTPPITTPDAPAAPDTLAETELETPDEPETLSRYDRGLPPRPEQLREMRRLEGELMEAVMAYLEGVKERRQRRAAAESAKEQRRSA